MSLSRTGATVGLVALAGCSLLTGASDLTTDPGITSGGAAKPDGAGGTGDQDGAIGGGTTDGGLDASTSMDATIDAALPPGRLRQITFENGTLTGLNGADTVIGSPACSSAGALHGKFSMTTSAAASYATAAFPPAGELFVTFVVKFLALPETTARFSRLKLTGTTPTFDLSVDHTGILSGSLGALTFGFGTITAGTTNRFGVHVQNNPGKNPSIDVFTAPDGQPFGVDPGGTVSMGTVGSVAAIGVGAMTDVLLRATFDDILLDTLAMPAP